MVIKLAPPAYQAALRRLLRRPGWVLFCDGLLRAGEMGTVHTYKRYVVVHLRPGMSLDDRVKTFVHEVIHAASETIPELTRRGKLGLYWPAKRYRIPERSIYRAEGEAMQSLDRRLAAHPQRVMDISVLSVCPGLLRRREGEILDQLELS